jgi:hypothetical protein
MVEFSGPLLSTRSGQSVTVQIAGGDAGEQVRRRVRHQRHGRLESAIAIAERQPIPGGGEIQLPVPVEIGYRYTAGARGTWRRALERKSAIAVVQVGVHGVWLRHHQVGDMISVQIGGKQAACIA